MSSVLLSIKFYLRISWKKCIHSFDRIEARYIFHSSKKIYVCLSSLRLCSTRSRYHWYSIWRHVRTNFSSFILFSCVCKNLKWTWQLKYLSISKPWSSTIRLAHNISTNSKQKGFKILEVWKSKNNKQYTGNSQKQKVHKDKQRSTKY